MCERFETLGEALIYVGIQYQAFCILEGTSNINSIYRGKLQTQVGNKRGVMSWIYCKRNSMWLHCYFIYEVSEGGKMFYDVESTKVLGK